MVDTLCLCSPPMSGLGALSLTEQPLGAREGPDGQVLPRFDTAFTGNGLPGVAHPPLPVLAEPLSTAEGGSIQADLAGFWACARACHSRLGQWAGRGWQNSPCLSWQNPSPLQKAGTGTMAECIPAVAWHTTAFTGNRLLGVAELPLPVLAEPLSAAESGHRDRGSSCSMAYHSLHGQQAAGGGGCPLPNFISADPLFTADGGYKSG